MINKNCLLLLLFLPPVIAQINWNKISFSDGGNSVCLTIDSLGYIYNVTRESIGIYDSPGDSKGSSIYRSTNEGNTWSELKFGPAGTMIRNMVVTGKGDLLIGTYHSEMRSNQGILLSTDHGETWQAINGNLPSKHVTALNCTQDNIIYAGITGPSLQSNLYKSTDYGQSWIPLGYLGTGYRYPTQLACYDNLVFSYTDWPDYVQYSTDAGTSWSSSNYTPGVFTKITSFAYKKSIGKLFVSNRYNAMENGDNYTLIVSEDTLKTVKDIKWSIETDYCHTLVLDSHGNLLGASSGSGVMKSTDDGKTWIKNNNMDNPFVNTLVIDKDGHIYAGSTSGVIKSTDGGNTWIELTRGLNAGKISSLKMDQNGNIFVQGSKVIFRYMMNGSRWEALNQGKKHPESGTLNIAGNNIFSCIDHRNGRWEAYKLGYKFNETLRRWVEINAYFTSVAQQPNGNLFGMFYEYGLIYGFYNSTDQGNSWTNLSAPPYKKIVQIDSRGNIYAAGTGLSVSLNNGHSFTPLNYNEDIEDFKIDKNDYMYIQPKYGQNSLNILRSKRPGGNWVNITEILSVRRAAKMYIDPLDRLFVIVDSSRIFISGTSGDKWSEITGNLNQKGIVDIALGANSMLYIAALSGDVYASSLNKSSDSQGYSLSENYPNPFNSSTTINYTIPASANVSIKLYDLLGTEIEQLLDAYKEAGEYRYEFRLEKFASGVYLYKFQSGQFTAIKKLLLIK